MGSYPLDCFDEESGEQKNRQIPYQGEYSLAGAHFHLDDPPEPIFYSFRKFLELTDPSVLSEGILKTQLRGLRQKYLLARRLEVERYCAKHGRNPADFPDPVEVREPKFRLSGPNISKDGFVASFASFYYQVAVGAGLTIALSVLLYRGATPLWGAISIGLLLIVWYLFLKKQFTTVLKFNEKFETARITYLYGKLAPLLKCLLDLEQEIAAGASGFRFSLQCTKSRRHLGPRAFSFNLISRAVRKRSPFFLTRQEDFVIRIHVLGDSLKAPLHILWWFEYPKSIFLSKSLMDNIQLMDRKLTIMLSSLGMKLAAPVRHGNMDAGSDER